METVQVGNMARGLGLIKDASIVTTLVILLRIVPVLLEIGNAKNVEMQRMWKCKECGITGHFAACCRKRDNKNPKEGHKKGNESGKKRAYQVKEKKKKTKTR